MSLAFQRQCKPMEGGQSGFVWLWCRVKAECDELFGRKLNLYDLRLPGLNGSAPLVAGGWLILRLSAVDAASAVGGGSVLHGVMAFPAVRRVPKIVGSPPARGNLAGVPSVHNLPPFANKVIDCQITTKPSHPAPVLPPVVNRYCTQPVTNFERHNHGTPCKSPARRGDKPAAQPDLPARQKGGRTAGARAIPACARWNVGPLASNGCGQCCWR